MTVLSSLHHFYHSSVGKKITVAVTGAVLFTFLAGHLAGNLLMFVGRDAMNAYAHFLQGFLHGWGVWAARGGLLAAFALHVTATVSLVRQNRAARQRYAHPGNVQASTSSRIMIVSGLVILCFVAYHLAHFTLRVGNDYGTDKYTAPDGLHDVYTMVVHGFSWWPASLFYIVGMALLCSHLGHGVASVFQTLGLATDKNWRLIKVLGNAFAVVLFVGFVSIPLAVLTGLIK